MGRVQDITCILWIVHKARSFFYGIFLSVSPFVDALKLFRKCDAFTCLTGNALGIIKCFFRWTFCLFAISYKLFNSFIVFWFDQHLFAAIEWLKMAWDIDYDLVCESIDLVPSVGPTVGPAMRMMVVWYSQRNNFISAVRMMMMVMAAAAAGVDYFHNGWCRMMAMTMVVMIIDYFDNFHCGRGMMMVGMLLNYLNTNRRWIMYKI